MSSPETAGSFRLSKSKYLAGLQCHKRVYLEVRAPELASEPDEQTQAILDMGTAVGELARQRFPGGILVEADYRHPTEALARTAALLQDQSVPAIFEGAVVFNKVLVRVDVLERVGTAPDGRPSWRLIEVKSATKVKDVYVNDVALQAHVLEGAGVPMAGAALMHVNTQYLHQGGDLDLDQLFTCVDLTALVSERQADVGARLAEMQAVLADPLPPAIEPDHHCHTPYECPFWDHCTKDKPARWVYYLPGGATTIQRLVGQGIKTMDEIPSGFKLTPIQRRVKEDAEWISPGLLGALGTVRFPVHHLDFETFNPALPRFPFTRPYQTLPVQWSNHVEKGDGQVRHEEFLSVDLKDPREAVALTLLESLGREGSICVYSGYERAVLESLALALPAVKRELEQVMARLWDLFPVLREHYYHPSFNGSFSMKSVLPALVPSMDYGNLDIREGGVAALYYYRMVFEETDWVEKERIRQALLAYCARDTLGMLEIRRALAGKVINDRHT